MGISVRHTWLAIAAAAGFSTCICGSAAAQTGEYPSDFDRHVAVDVASAASLGDAAVGAAALEDATVDAAAELDAAERDAPDRLDAPYAPPRLVPAREISAQDGISNNYEDIDDPPIAGDANVIDEAIDSAGAARESVIVDNNGDYIREDWVYEDDSSFAWLISSGTWLHRGRWFAQTEATLVHRSTAPQQILSDVPLLFQSQQFFSEAMTTETSGFGYEPGLRVTVGKYLGRDAENRDRTLEFTFWGLNDWTSQHAITAVAPASLFQLFRTPLDRGIGAYNFSTDHQYTYESDLNSFEMNAKVSRRLGRDRMVLTPDGQWERQCDPGKTPTFLAGFRTILIDEDFSFDAQRPELLDITSFGGAPIDLPAADGQYDISAQNRLFGMQLGAEMIQQHCNWSFGVRGKLGGYANFVEQSTRVRIVDPFVGLSESNRDERASDVQMAMVAEVGLIGTYQIRPNVALRCAYDFMYLQGLALAPQQLDFNSAPTPNVRSGSHQFLNGGSVGLEFVW
ncbi:MAG: BBP7 family outer membrane beta-barrel protein [Pirellulales bacterium]